VISKVINKIKSKYERSINLKNIKKNMKTSKEYHDILKSLKDKYKGERCFILGNGPSLNKCDLALLKDEYSFAVNGIFYKTKEMNYKPNFYMVEDNHVVYDNLKEINKYQCEYKFFPSNYKNVIVPDETTIFMPSDFGFYREYHPYYCIPRFSTDVSNEIFAGQSVTIMQLQMAYHLGFSHVYLIGMDFSYALPESTKVEGCNYTSQEDDVNHFHPDYFGKGKKWHDPKLDRVLMNYQKCKEEFELDGRKIYNATKGGKLEIFDRVDYDTLFNN
jgi:hypothetical protein